MAESLKTFRSQLPALALALVLAAIGGVLFSWMKTPLPWMLGPMTACCLAAIAGAKLRAPVQIRPLMSAVLGIMLGSTFTPEMLSHIGHWVVSLLFLGGYILTVAAIGYPYYRKVAGYDRPTAFFSVMPGGFGEMFVIGTSMGADPKAVTLSHSVRILLVVFTLPFLFQALAGVGTIDRARTAVWLGQVPLQDLAVMTACAAIGWPVARWLRIPAAPLFGALVLSAVVHLTGLAKSQPPREVVNLAQYVIGCVAGCRFVGTPLREVVRGLGIGIGMTVIMLGTTIGFAALISALSDLDFPSIVLAFSPGGLAEMSLIALALGIDVAYVATHHIARIMLITLAAPLFFKAVGHRPAPPSDE